MPIKQPKFVNFVLNNKIVRKYTKEQILNEMNDPTKINNFIKNIRPNLYCPNYKPTDENSCHGKISFACSFEDNTYSWLFWRNCPKFPHKEKCQYEHIPTKINSIIDDETVETIFNSASYLRQKNRLIKNVFNQKITEKYTNDRTKISSNPQILLSKKDNFKSSNAYYHQHNFIHSIDLNNYEYDSTYDNKYIFIYGKNIKLLKFKVLHKKKNNHKYVIFSLIKDNKYIQFSFWEPYEEIDDNFINLIENENSKTFENDIFIFAKQNPIGKTKKGNDKIFYIVKQFDIIKNK